MTDQQQPQRGRPRNDAEQPAIDNQQAPEERRERRRKDGEAENAGMRLAIPDAVYEKYPRKHFKLAWIADDPGRMHLKHSQDWDVVAGVTRVPGARDVNGNPVDHVLCVKRQEWVDEDRARLEQRRKEIERQAEIGKVAGRGDDNGQTLAENVSYAEASNRLR